MWVDSENTFYTSFSTYVLPARVVYSPRSNPLMQTSKSFLLQPNTFFLKIFLTNMIGHLWWGEQKSDFTQLFQSVNFHPVLWRFSIRDQLKILYIFYSYAIWPLSFIHLNSVSLCAGISTLYNLGVSALNTSWQSCKHGCGLFVLRRRNCNSVQGHS